jgi:hypothetical protein
MQGSCTIRNDCCQVIEGSAKRFGYQLQKMQVMHGSQHMRALGALLASCLDQAAVFEPLEHPVQQKVLRLTGYQAGTKLR